MFGLTFSQMLALASEASELVEMAKEVAAIIRKHEAMLIRIVAALHDDHDGVPHDQAVQEVAEIVREQIPAEALDILARREQSGNN